MLTTNIIILMKKKSISTLVFICLSTFVAISQFQKTQILILGTPHLTQIKEFEPAMLNNVISKLDSSSFDAVCIEKMPDMLLYDVYNRNDKTFNGVTGGRWGKAYLSLADTVQKVRSIKFLEAEDSITNILKRETLTPEERKELFYYYLASTDIPSAALQYQYLEVQHSLFQTEFDKYLIDQIQNEIKTNSEFYTLALPLAFHQKLNRIEAINDFQDEALLMKYHPEFGKDCQEHSEQLSSISSKPVYQKMMKLTKQSVIDNDLSDLYSFVNSEEYMAQDYNAQWKIWLETNFSSQSDRARFSLWQMRNLQIAANILNVVSQHAGEKIIVIIGSSHKGFLESYLSQIEDVELLDFE